jgi:hypothetical protein
MLYESHWHPPLEKKKQKQKQNPMLYEEIIKPKWIDGSENWSLILDPRMVNTKSMHKHAYDDDD